MSDSKNIILDFSRMEVGHHELQYTLDDAFFAALDQNEVLAGNVIAKAVIEAGENTFRLHVEVNGQVSVTCDRCLDPVAEPVCAEDDVLIKLADEDGEDDTCVYLNAEHPVLDLGWLFYEIVSVSLPIVCRHPEGECNPQMEELLQAHLCSTIDEMETDAER